MAPRPSRHASTVAKTKIAEDAVSDGVDVGIVKGKRGRAAVDSDGDDEGAFSHDDELDDDPPSDSADESLSDLDQSTLAPSLPPPATTTRPKPKAKAKPKAAESELSPAAASPTSTAAASPSATATTATTPSPKKRAKLPPYEMDPETGEPLLDGNGKPVKRIPKPRQKKVAPEPVYGSDGEIVPPQPKQKRQPKVKEVVIHQVPEVEHKHTTFKGRLGYACLNSLLRSRKPADKSVFTSRTMRLATFQSELGQQKLHDMTDQNTKDLCEILLWNADNNIRLFRLSSEMFPFASHGTHGYSITTLPRAMANLAEAGRIAKEHDIRITAHPGQWTQLASPREQVVTNAIRELVYHCEMMDAMGCGKDSVMVIHMGGVYEDKVATLDRFRKNYVELVPEHVKARLVLENDEICYNVADLLPICQELNIPLILDYHHDSIYRSPLPPALMMADILATWSRKGIRCKQHLSEARYGARTMPERRGHSDRCQELPLGLEESIKIMKGREERGEPYEEREGWSEEGWVEGGAGFEGIREFGTRMGLPDDVDLMIEAKDKEQAVLHLYNIYQLYPVANESYLPPKPPTPPEAAEEGEDDGAALVDADGNPIKSASVSPAKTMTPMARAKKAKAEAKVAAGKRREEREMAKKVEGAEEALPLGPEAGLIKEENKEEGAKGPSPAKKRKSPAKAKKEEAGDSGVKVEEGEPDSTAPEKKERKVSPKKSAAPVEAEPGIADMTPIQVAKIEEAVAVKGELGNLLADDQDEGSDLSELEDL